MKAQETSQQQYDYGNSLSKAEQEASSETKNYSKVRIGTEDSPSLAGDTKEIEKKKPRVESEKTGKSPVSDQINVDFYDNSKENPIAISNDDSEEEMESVSTSRKRKTDDDVSESLGRKFPPEISSSLSTHAKDIDDSKPLDYDSPSKPKKIKDVEQSDLDTSRDRLKLSLPLNDESGINNAIVTMKPTSPPKSIGDFHKILGETVESDVEEETYSKILKIQSLKKKLFPESLIPVSNHSSETLAIHSTEDKTNQLDSTRTDSQSTIQNVKERSQDLFSREHTDTTAALSFQEMTNLTREYSGEKSRTKNEYSPSKKDDIDKPCSRWKIEMFSRYFDFEKCIAKLKLERYKDFSRESDLNHMVADFKRRVKIASSTVAKHTAFKGDTLIEKGKEEDEEETKEEGRLSFASLCITEMGTRLILNEILFPLCSILDFTVEIERSVDCVYLPNCRFDYRIYDADGEIVGAAETKRDGSIRPDSVVQAVLELCILQTERLTKSKNNTKSPDFPLFNILTDGMRFVFIILQGNKLYFEQSFNKIRVREMTSWTEVYKLYRSLLQLMRMRTREQWTSSPWKLDL